MGMGRHGVMAQQMKLAPGMDGERMDGTAIAALFQFAGRTVAPQDNKKKEKHDGDCTRPAADS